MLIFWGTNRHNNHKKVSLHCLISHGNGLLVIPENRVPEFKKLLVGYYEGEYLQVIASFMSEYCLRH